MMPTVQGNAVAFYFDYALIYLALAAIAIMMLLLSYWYVMFLLID